MLSEKVLRKVVDDAIIKYEGSNDGVKGWSREDVQKSIRELGGTKDDLYSAMILGFEACFGKSTGSDHLLS